MIEVYGGGTTVQLEGMGACCVSELQGYTSIAMREEGRAVIGMVDPAESQCFTCPHCSETLIFWRGAWRNKRLMGVTNTEFGV